MLSSIDAKREAYAGVAKQIWAFAELGYQEQQSSALLQQQLRAAGFQVTPGEESDRRMLRAATRLRGGPP